MKCAEHVLMLELVSQLPTRQTMIDDNLSEVEAINKYYFFFQSYFINLRANSIDLSETKAYFVKVLAALLEDGSQATELRDAFLAPVRLWAQYTDATNRNNSDALAIYSKAISDYFDTFDTVIKPVLAKYELG